MIRILIVDDHDLVREGIRAILEKKSELEVVGECGDGQQAIRDTDRLKPDVVLMDLNLPGGIGGLEAAEAILGDHPGTKVIILTQHGDREYIKRAIRIGAQGYLLKSSVSAQLEEAIDAVVRGRRYLHPVAAQELVDIVTSEEGLGAADEYESLTRREKQVFKLLVEGKTSREIARYLGISLKTAMTHRTHVMGKLRVHSRTELIRYALRKKIVPLDG
ncbi:MAG: response regulator transcription factor [Acidobacteriota bacterium]|nr:response regulator transcription factor [Acidobacteriota bacterium]